jgi:hypothetical protein
LIEFELLLCNRSLHRILRSENVVKFLKLHLELVPFLECCGTNFETYSAILGLRHKIPDDARLDETPDQEYSVRLPFDVRKSHWEAELVDQGT